MRMMVLVGGVAAAMLLAGLPAAAQAPQPAPASAEAEQRIGDVLFWAPERREARFREMETLAPHARVANTGPVRPLPQGAPLKFDPSAYMEAERVAGLLVIHKGQVRLERYGLGVGPGDRWVSFSLTKSLVATLVGAAIKDGHIRSLDDPVSAYLPDLVGDGSAGGYEGVTLRQLLTMTSGVAWNEDYADPQSDVARFLDAEPEPGMDATVSYMRRLPRQAEPGTRWLYNTGETNLVGVLLRAAVGRPLSDYLAEKLWTPLGMETDGQWMLDVQGKEVGGCCLSASLRDWGRVGLFALADGVTPDGDRVTPEGWFAEATRTQADTGNPYQTYGYLWWVMPGDQFGARGIFGQALQVDRERELVMVTLSAWPTAVGRERAAARNAMFDAIAAEIDAEAAAGR